MATNHVELENFLNINLVEEAHRKALLNQQRRNQSFADTGYRAAVARDPKLLKALEVAANLIDKMQESQLGRTMRDPGAAYSHTKGTTEAQLWREAYRLCDEGKPIRNFEWIYGAAAWLCGFNT
jgi:hypothetical protein